MGLRDFPPTGTATSVKDSFGTISIGQVLPERNESGTITGLCYVELSSESDARKALQLLRDGVLIGGRVQVQVAFLPLNELDMCAKNLDRLRDVMSGNSTLLSRNPIDKLGSAMKPLPLNSMSPVSSFNNGNPPTYAGNGHESSSSIHRPRSSTSFQRVLISGLPPTAMERDVGDFFSDVGVIPQLIEIVYDDSHAPIGSAFCQFGSTEEAERALDKNGGFLDGHTIKISLVDNPDSFIPASSHVYEDVQRPFSPYERNLNEVNDSNARMLHNHRPQTGSSYNRSMDGERYQQIGPRFSGPRHSLRGGGFGG